MAKKTISEYSLVLRNKNTGKYEFLPGPAVWCSWNAEVCERFYMLPVNYHDLDIPYKNRAHTKQDLLDYISKSKLLHHMTKKALAEKLESVITGEAS